MPEGYQIRAKNTTSGKRFDFGHPYPTLNEAITGLSEWKNVSQVDINSNTFTEGTYTFTWDEIKIYYRNPDNTVDETTVYYTDNWKLKSLNNIHSFL